MEPETTNRRRADPQSAETITRSIRQTAAGRAVYTGMVIVGILFVSTLVLPVTDPVARTVATVAFGLMSGLWLATLLYEVGRQTATTGTIRIDWARLARLYALIAAVSAVSLFVFAQQFAGTTLTLVVFAVGAVAVLSAILGALVAGAAFVGEASMETVVDVSD